MKTFKPTDLQKKLGSVFNSVQADGVALIDSRSRPNMILILENDYIALQKKQAGQLSDLNK